MINRMINIRFSTEFVNQLQAIGFAGDPRLEVGRIRAELPHVEADSDGRYRFPRRERRRDGGGPGRRIWLVAELVDGELVLVQAFVVEGD